MVLPPAACFPPPGTQLPGHLIVDFWYKVHHALTAAHGLDPDDAAGTIVAFRAAADGRVGDLLYHSAPDELAASLAAGHQNRLAVGAPSPVSLP